MMPALRQILAAWLGALVLVSGCNLEDEQETFWAEALAEPSGITETTESGTVVSTDPEDWRVSPRYRGLVTTIEPPYPNPSEGQTVILTVDYSAIQGAPQQLFLVVVEEERLSVIDEVTGTAGAYQFSFNPSATLGEPGLYRLLILDDGDELISYGDIEVE